MSCTEPRKQTHPVWVLKTLLDIIKADDDRQLVADRHDLEPRKRVCVREKAEGSICRNFTTNNKGYPSLKLKCLFLGHFFTEDRQNSSQGCVPMMLQNDFPESF